MNKNGNWFSKPKWLFLWIPETNFSGHSNRFRRKRRGTKPRRVFVRTRLFRRKSVVWIFSFFSRKERFQPPFSLQTGVSIKPLRGFIDRRKILFEISAFSEENTDIHFS